MSTTLPTDPTKYAMKWDGEWHITYEVFRDMGIAFAAVLVLIYFLVVGWFKSFVTPLIIMAPIPLTLIGILPAHGLFGIFFTATSMIGFIALAGIIVRNSILLVDFINLELEMGEKLEDAVIKAGAVRFRRSPSPPRPSSSAAASSSSTRSSRGSPWRSSRASSSRRP
jgi:Cation/multidrug efflux pump